MAYSKKLAGKIRQALAHHPDVEEKKMFGKLAFMVGGKLCLTAGTEKMMCRIDPDLHEQSIKKEGCETVIMRGKEYQGYVYVDMDNLRTKDDFNYWVELALDFNKKVQQE